jgi:hypothetical protein
MSVSHSSRSLVLRTRPLFQRVSTSIPRLSRTYSSEPPSKNGKAATTKAITTASNDIPILKKRSELLREEKLKLRKDEIDDLKQKYQPYSEEEWAALSQFYTPAQVEALKAAEEAIDIDDFATQFGPREDRWLMEYNDDLAEVQPLVDYKELPEITHAPNYRFVAREHPRDKLRRAGPMLFFEVDDKFSAGEWLDEVPEKESKQEKMTKVREVLEKLRLELPEKIDELKLQYNEQIAQWQSEEKAAIEMFEQYNKSPDKFIKTLKARKKMDGPEQVEMLQWWKRAASHTLFTPLEVEGAETKVEAWPILPTGQQIMDVEKVIDEVFEQDELELQESAVKSLASLKKGSAKFLEKCKEALTKDERERRQSIRLWTAMIDEWKAESDLPEYADIRLAADSENQNLPSQEDVAALDSTIEETIKSLESQTQTSENTLGIDILQHQFESKDEQVKSLLDAIDAQQNELQSYLSEDAVDSLLERYEEEKAIYYWKPSRPVDADNEVVEDTGDALERMDEYWGMLSENFQFQAMSLTEMLYRVERSKLRPEVKSELRKLYVYKGTFKEYMAKALLWEFVPKRQDMPRIAPEGKLSIQELLGEVDQLEMDDIKKHEILAYSHWVNTPKEESLRPMLERVLAEHPRSPEADSSPQRLRMLLNIIKDKMKVGLDRDDLVFKHKMLENAARKVFKNVPSDLVVGEAKDIAARQVYSAVHPDMPKIKDPRVKYTAGAEDGKELALQRLAKQTGYTVKQLGQFRVRQLTTRFVANQTRKGKIRSMYVLSVAGNQNGLVGIGEGKSVEAGDAVLQSHVNALRNMKPVYRYENRTIYGELDKRVGGTTVQLSSRPPGKPVALVNG